MTLTPLTMPLLEAAEILGISRNMAYRLAERDEFPVPILRIGKLLKVSREAVENYVNRLAAS